MYSVMAIFISSIMYCNRHVHTDFSITLYHYSLRNNPEERGPLFWINLALKSTITGFCEYGTDNYDIKGEKMTDWMSNC